MSSVYEVFAQAQQRVSPSLVGRLRRFESTETFATDLQNCTFRILNVRKQEPVGDRLIRFLVSYLQASSEHVTITLSAILPFLMAKDKSVRFRATQIIAQAINSLDSIDDELYHDIRQALMKRIRDKVPAVRIQAVIGLGRLAENEMDDNAENDSDSDSEITSQNLLERLLDILQNDTNAEVRRILLQNLPLTPATLPYALERARDRDALTRRAVYAKLLPNLGDFRHLSLSMREKLLRWGLRDRDESVRKATGRLFRERWIEDCAATTTNTDNLTDPQPPQQEPLDSHKKRKTLLLPSLPALLELLERIDVVNSGTTESGIALLAMKDFWTGRPDYVDSLADTFSDDQFWLNLSPESAFLARTYNDFCTETPAYQATLSDTLPEITRLGFYLQKSINILLENIRSTAPNNTVEDDDTAVVESEFITLQLLHIAHTQDYTGGGGDEIGRRKMFALLRNTLALPELPEPCTGLVVETLRLICGADEREFCAIVLEAVAEVHDNINTTPTDQDEGEEEESFVSAKSDPAELSDEELERKALREVIVNMKILHIASIMLQNVSCPHGGLSGNQHLVSTLNNLVIPAVRSHEAPIRERGILCLGQYCLLDKGLARDNLGLFRHCFTRGGAHTGLRVRALEVLCDVVLQHGMAAEVELGCFVEGLEMEGEVRRCSLSCLAKLMLARLHDGENERGGGDGDGDGEDGDEEGIGKKLEKAVDQAVLDEVPGADMLVKVREAVGKALEEKRRETEKERLRLGIAVVEEAV